MLLFSTMLAINDSLTKEKFIELVIKWNQGSPHADNVISGIEWNGERNIKFEDGRLSLAIEEYRNGNTIAVRYEKKDADGVVWDTDYAEDFTSCMQAYLLQQPGKSGDESKDVAVFDGAFGNWCYDEYLYTSSIEIESCV